MQLHVESYREQSCLWPSEGRHILAQFDDATVVVYQAYRAEIGLLAARQGYFDGGGFSTDRMSWVKPNFLWMMYRSGWATKPGQEVILAVRLQRRAFDEILCRAVHSTFMPELHANQEAWRRNVARSDVRLQWDPDHSPHGQPLMRRAIQLGLRGEALRQCAREWILAIEDITPFVQEQREQLKRGTSQLLTPREQVYPVTDSAVATRIGVESWAERKQP